MVVIDEAIEKLQKRVMDAMDNAIRKIDDQQLEIERLRNCLFKVKHKVTPESTIGQILKEHGL
jgi:hypothetical protein